MVQGLGAEIGKLYNFFPNHAFHSRNLSESLIRVRVRVSTPASW